MSSFTCGTLQHSCNLLRLRYHHVETEELQVLSPECTVALSPSNSRRQPRKIGYIIFRGLLDSGDQLLERKFLMHGTGCFV